ncbi:hypothetical protein F9B85_10330 [Heliorestis acidaminivorans]|uniref:Phage tail protein I n=1 Tax=Heliorestis acidaminivorans TaxID=553427 RepID=A0A6I0ER55_9FIRM|nr:phage tail protein [Heliorestis acidaminivorans]KAB2951946.1 hypothetical protein F9B85_10330 [Heliorestis acidaminivorans]
MKEGNSFVLTMERYFRSISQTKAYSGIQKESFISEALDSMENDTLWHRCKLDASMPEDTKLIISYFASNELTAEQQWQEEIINVKDFLLHKARGRYLWLRIEYISYGNQVPSIKDIQIDFPMQPLTWKLPEIYQQDEKSADLLHRFLGIFQSLMKDLDVKIQDRGEYLDLKQADREYLQWLSHWLDIREYYLWPADKLRLFMEKAYSLYRIKGTRRAIEEVTEIYTGEKPWIVEQHQIARQERSEQAKVYSRLYGDNEYTFTVIVKEEAVPTSKHYLELKRIIESFTPAHAIMNLVVLKSYFFLDSYTYLGINSVVSGSGRLVLDGKASIPFASMIEERRAAE